MGRVFTVFLLLAVIFGGFFFLNSRSFSLQSPIPKVFGTANKKVEIVNNWFPKETSFVTNLQPIDLSAKSAILVDFDSGEVLFRKDDKQRLPAASTIKIMTALVALENRSINDSFTVSENAAKIGENSMGLTNGEKLTLEELLYGLMLVSGNDAAVTIAEGISGNEGGFVKLMNDKVKSLGLSDSRFVNASGLDEDGKDQYTTAYDMAVIAHYTWKNFPVFRQITSTFNKYIEATDAHKAFDLYNDTNLLTTYPGVKGIKPGFTWEAGLCLVTYAENKQSLRSSSSTAGLDEKKLLGVILGSDDRRGEMKELLDFGFGHYGISVDHPALDL